MESLEKEVINLLTEKFGDRPKLTDSLAVFGVDSIGMAELTVELEKVFGIRVKDDIVNVDTVQDLVNYIQKQRQSSSSAT